MKALYVNPFTDFGFKKIFGEDASKPLLIDFLNALLRPQRAIVDIAFKKTEKLGRTDADRKAIFDIYCENSEGEKFIVELQKAKRNHFKERMIFYSTFPICEQAEKGEWDFELKAVYCIGILDFRFGDYENESENFDFMHTVQLKNQHGKVFYDKLLYVYLEMPNFQKTEAQLETRLDKWLFFIKYLEDFQTIPAILKDEVFEQAFEKASLAKLDQSERYDYEMNLKSYRDYKGTIDYAFMDGQRKTLEKLVRAFHRNGVAMDIIVASTGLSKDEIQKILDRNETE